MDTYICSLVMVTFFTEECGIRNIVNGHYVTLIGNSLQTLSVYAGSDTEFIVHMFTVLQGIPYRLYAGSDTRFIVHLSLCGLGLLLAIITCIVQLISPAPYGKHEDKVF